MKLIVKTFFLTLSIGLMIAFSSCNDGDEDCPDKTFNSLQECEDATDGMKCVCVKEGSGWKAVLNP